MFGRKSKETPPVESELDAAIADLDVIEEKLEPMVEASSPPEPEVEDHADAVVADEPTIHAARRPSLAHSAEDAAQLAGFLSTPSRQSRSPKSSRTSRRSS